MFRFYILAVCFLLGSPISAADYWNRKDDLIDGELRFKVVLLSEDEKRLEYKTLSLFVIGHLLTLQTQLLSALKAEGLCLPDGMNISEMSDFSETRLLQLLGRVQSSNPGEEMTVGKVTALTSEVDPPRHMNDVAPDSTKVGTAVAALPTTETTPSTKAAAALVTQAPVASAPSEVVRSPSLGEYVVESVIWMLARPVEAVTHSIWYVCRELYRRMTG